ncbi:unnamed protein product [Prunus armeniaca]
MQALPISGGEQCIGFAINGSEFEKPENNPAITCDCTYDKYTTCHITKLRLHALNKRGVFPKEFEALRYLCLCLQHIKDTGFSVEGANSDRELTMLYASDNPFSGKIPSFVGNWRKLTSLVLRNTLINGSIPTDFGEYQRLQILDLGFNNLTGELPREPQKEGLRHIESADFDGSSPDTLVWGPSSNGEFTVKSAYNICSSLSQGGDDSYMCASVVLELRQYGTLSPYLIVLREVNFAADSLAIMGHEMEMGIHCFVLPRGGITSVLQEDRDGLLRSRLIYV